MTSLYEDLQQGESTSSLPPLTDPLLTAPTHQRHDSNQEDLRQRHRNAPFPNQGRILDRDADYYQSRGRWHGVELLPRASGRRNRSSLTLPGQYHSSQQRQHQTCCSLQAIHRRLRRYWPRLWDDWFHTLAYQRTIVLMLVLFVVYTSIVVAFGFLYLAVSILGATKTQQADGSFVTNTFCDMDIADHMEALYFSLSTMTTIGYGVSDYYFGGCWTPLLMVLMQVCTAITFDACAVGLLFTRLSRGRKRGKSVVVSNQAVVQVVQGVPYFMIRVGELRRFPLINASVRLYCIRHERIPRVTPTIQGSSIATTAAGSGSTGTSLYQDLASAAREASAKINDDASTTTTAPTSNSPHNPSSEVVPIETAHFMTRAMKLLHPDESLMHSNFILMSLPQVIVHRMDAASPLMPPSEWYDARGRRHTFPQNKDNLLDVQAQIQAFWMDRGLEVIVLVEGTDELTGAAIQARHSYCTSPPLESQEVENRTTGAREDDENHDEGDVVWNRAFANCILPCQSENADIGDAEMQGPGVTRGGQQSRQSHRASPVCTVDFSLFHDTVPTPRNCFASPHVPFTTVL